MMSSLIFWKNWPSSYKRLWYILCAVFLFSFGYMWFCRWQGVDGIIHWERIQEQKVIESTVHQFRVGPFNISVPADTLVIFEYFQGSDVQHNFTASAIFLIVLSIAIAVLLSVISTTQGFWYFAGMSLFIILFVSLRLEVLAIGGFEGLLIPGLLLLPYLVASFYFKSIRTHTSFHSRVFTFATIILFTVVIIFTLSTVTEPLLHLTLTAYTPALILTMIFIAMVAHEIMASFVYISGSGKSDSLWHFFLISILYLAYLMITALHEMGTINWNLLYMDVYLLISISAILGLWGFKLRENLYDNIVSFSPIGAFFFIAFASIAFITLSQLLGNANDAALRVLKDLIIFSHTGFGIAFLLYMASNFMPMMSENLAVYPVLYKPSQMPYFSFRLAGVVATSVFVFLSYWRDYVFNSKAGFYNYAGDLHMQQGNEEYARAFYERARINAFQNHRANYELGLLKASRLDFEKASENFELANAKRPSPYSLVNEGIIHLWRKQYFPARDIYQAAQKRSSSPALDINLGYTYARIHNVDSSLHYFNEARKNELTKNTAEANFFAVLASEYIPVHADSIFKSFETESRSVTGNAIGAATIFNQDFKSTIDPLKDKSLDLYSATLLNNYIVHHVRKLDSAFVEQALQVANDSLNFSFSEPIKSSLAIALYHQGNVERAHEILAELVFLSQSNKGKYNYLLGLWALEQGSPVMAHEYFFHSVSTQYKKARFYDAIALSESLQEKEAVIAWDSILRYGEENEKIIAANMKKIFSLTPQQAITASDAEKYQYLRYRISPRDTTVFKKICPTLENANYKAQALLDMSKKLFYADMITSAITFYNQIGGLQLNDKKLYDDIRHFELRMLASRAEIQNLAKQINKDITFNDHQKLDKLLYTALIQEFSGDTLQAAKNFEILGTWNPFFEDGILAAANYFRNHDDGNAKSYTILAEAIQINSKSLRLLKAYAAEARRLEMNEYAESAEERIRVLEENL